MTRNDIELLLVALFWGFNISVLKVALREIEPLAFNQIRFVCASLLLLGLVRILEGSVRVARRDLGPMLFLGFVGHLAYQLCFILGLARTTASSTALIFGSTPIVVALLSRLAGHERIGRSATGAALVGFSGVYLMVWGKEEAGVTAPGRIIGDLLVLGAVICWSAYTVGSRGILREHSPLRVTAVTTSLGALMMLPPSVPSLMRQDWAAVSVLAWSCLAYSFLFALVICYVLWYRSVRRVGSFRTSIYSNLVPVLGTLFGVWLLGERLTPLVILGGVLVLAGILLTPPESTTARP